METASSTRIRKKQNDIKQGGGSFEPPPLTIDKHQISPSAWHNRPYRGMFYALKNAL